MASNLTRMTADMDWHVKNSTRAEDFGHTQGWTGVGDKFKFPFKSGVCIYSYVANDDSGTISYWNCENDHGYKFSLRIIHGKIIKTTCKKGDVFFEAEETKYDPHIHIECHDIGHKDKDTIQNNRNKITVIEGVAMQNKKNSGSSTTPPSEESTKSYNQANDVNNQKGGGWQSVTKWGDTIPYKIPTSYLSGNKLKSSYMGWSTGTEFRWYESSTSTTFKIKRTSSQTETGTYEFNNSDKSKFTISGSSYKVKGSVSSVQVRDVKGGGWKGTTTFTK